MYGYGSVGSCPPQDGDSGMNASTGIKVVYAKSSSRWMDRVTQVNRELWLVLSLFVLAGLLNWLVASHGMVLGFYTLPTLFSAYVYGRKHAVLTAVGSSHQEATQTQEP